MFKEQLYKKALKYFLGDYILNKLDSEGDEFFNNKLDEKSVSAITIDWHSFTTLDKNITQPELIEILNCYLEKCTEIILKNNGYIENIIGNSINAIFGLSKPNYIRDICNCAKEIIEFEKVINKKYDFEDFIKFKIGISSGINKIGIIGSKNKLHYTLIGISMSNAITLCNLNKEYKTKILVDDETFSQAKNNYNMNKIDSVYQKLRNGNIVFNIYSLS